MSSNDDDKVASKSLSTTANAHGHAALILVESLLHGLVSRAVLTAADALVIIEAAEDVQKDYIALNSHDLEMLQSHAVLTAIAASMSIDIMRHDSIASHSSGLVNDGQSAFPLREKGPGSVIGNGIAE